MSDTAGRAVPAAQAAAVSNAATVVLHAGRSGASTSNPLHVPGVRFCITGIASG